MEIIPIKTIYINFGLLSSVHFRRIKVHFPLKVNWGVKGMNGGEWTFIFGEGEWTGGDWAKFGDLDMGEIGLLYGAEWTMGIHLKNEKMNVTH